MGPVAKAIFSAVAFIEDKGSSKNAAAVNVFEKFTAYKKLIKEKFGSNCNILKIISELESDPGSVIGSVALAREVENPKFSADFEMLQCAAVVFQATTDYQEPVIPHWPRPSLKNETHSTLPVARPSIHYTPVKRAGDNVVTKLNVAPWKLLFGFRLRGSIGKTTASMLGKPEIESAMRVRSRYLHARPDPAPVGISPGMPNPAPVNSSPAIILYEYAAEDIREVNSSLETAPRPDSPREAPRRILVTAYDAFGEAVISFKSSTRYALRICVSEQMTRNLAQGNLVIEEVPELGLPVHWVVASKNVRFLAVSPPGSIIEKGDMSLAEFDLLIPPTGDSDSAILDIQTTTTTGELTLALLVNGEEYRKVTIELTFGPKLMNDIVGTLPKHLNLNTIHEWTTPPVHIEINVFGQLARVSTILGTNDYGTVEWTANSTTLKTPIQRVRNALEKFRVAAEASLNDLDVADMEQRLSSSSWKPVNWSFDQLNAADANHVAAFDAFAAGKELHSLASDGYRLFDLCFPPNSDLRTIIETLAPGSRIDFVWPSRGSTDWVAHVPWGLMYMKPPKASEAIDCTRFLGLRYRLGSKSWEPNAPSRALGGPAEVSALHFMYWGSDPMDEVGAQALWQRKEFGQWEHQHFVPDSSLDNPKSQVVAALELPKPDPAGILYFYCHCSVKDGSEPVLQFGETGRTLDVIEATDIYQGRLEAGPLVFANACSTTVADPQGTSELESRFFARDIRAFLGTESKVPIILASRFAWLFFQFFLRKADPSPMAAGEALAQARLFLWTQYRNLGGLFYCLVNQYSLYLASDAELAQLQRKY